MRRVLEVVIDVTRSDRVRAERAAYALGAQGVEIRDGERDRVKVVTWMPIGTKIPPIADARVTVRPIAATWYQPPPPPRVGRFVIVDLDAPCPANGIRVDGAFTFGDGVHPTTAMCLEAMPRAATVLDVGTGTGILAIAAAKLGAERVVATDIDPLARDAARRAVRANDVRVRVQSRLPRARFDLVVANLYLEPLVALADEIAARVERTLIVSGFTDEAPVRRAFGGLRVERRWTRDRWRCLRLTR